MNYLITHKDGRQGVGSPSGDSETWPVKKACGFCESWSDKDVEQCIYLHPGLVDPLIEAQRLDDEGDEGPFVWRSGHKVIDRGPMKSPVVITYRVQVIDPAQAFLALEGTCMPTGDLADSWEVPEDVVLDLVAKSDVERCNTCGWWSHKDELELVDDEPKCIECREDDE